MEERMKSDYRNLLSPLTVRNMTLKNRVAMTPMGTNYAEQNGEIAFCISITMSRGQKAARVL